MCAFEEDMRTMGYRYVVHMKQRCGDKGCRRVQAQLGKFREQELEENNGMHLCGTRMQTQDKNPGYATNKGDNGKPWLRFRCKQNFCTRIHNMSKKLERKTRRFMKRRNILLFWEWEVKDNQTQDLLN